MPHTSVLPRSIAYLAEAPTPGFECTCRAGGFDSVWVRVAGELDLCSASLLEQALRGAERHARMVVLDLRELTFMDSAGLHVIINATARIRQAGRRVVLVRGPAHVDRLFAVTRAAAVLEVGDLEPVQYAQVPAPLPRED